MVTICVKFTAQMACGWSSVIVQWLYPKSSVFPSTALSDVVCTLWLVVCQVGFLKAMFSRSQHIKKKKRISLLTNLMNLCCSNSVWLAAAVFPSLIDTFLYYEQETNGPHRSPEKRFQSINAFAYDMTYDMIIPKRWLKKKKDIIFPLKTELSLFI